jgi:hypothetical protein
MDSDQIVEKLISCEGWREDVLMFVMDESEKVKDPTDQGVVAEIFSRVPAPKSSYPLEGVSRLDVSLAVDKAFSRLQ